jgi:folylpolyglutamate synthase/dihydropteroate synthase
VTQDPSALIPLVREADYLGAVEVVPVLSEAISQAEHLAGDSGMVCITGSLYLVGEARTVYGLEPD